MKRQGASKLSNIERSRNWYLKAAPATCAFEFNSTVHTCNEVCENAGGECVGAWNDSGTCGYGDWLGCDGYWYTSAMCVCSRGCGMNPPCDGSSTCVDGDCV